MNPERLPDPVIVAVRIAQILDRHQVKYLIGGSLASSLHGEPRSTNDVDIIAQLGQNHIAAVIGELGSDWYVSEDAVRSAVAGGGSFNAIHIGSAVKVDIFVTQNDALDTERLSRRLLVNLTSGDQEAAVYVDSAEGTVLRKLEWYRRGGEESERQWRDVVGVLRVQGPHLNFEYLESWARRTGVLDLLGQARNEALQ